MDGEAPRGLLRIFEDVEDPRLERNKLHRLADILAITLLAVIRWSAPGVRRNGRGTRASYWSNSKRISNQHAESWANLPARLQKTGCRLRGVQIECLPYQETLRRLDKPNVVVFLDPPYLPSTRGAPKVYPHEFNRKEHELLLDRVGKIRKAKVMLCGYRSELYRTHLEGWHRTDFETKSFAASRVKGSKRDNRTLSLWTNYDPPLR